LQTLAAKLRQPIDGFSEGSFIRPGSASPKDSPLFRRDVFVVPDSETEGRYQARLTEINPWGPKTDTCLFRWWASGDLDGFFRHLK